MKDKKFILFLRAARLCGGAFVLVRKRRFSRTRFEIFYARKHNFVERVGVFVNRDLIRKVRVIRHLRARAACDRPLPVALLVADPKGLVVCEPREIYDVEVGVPRALLFALVISKI